MVRNVNAALGYTQMWEMLMEYGLFLAKTVTVVVAVGAIAALVAAAARRGRGGGGGGGDQLKVTCLNDRYRDLERALSQALLPRKQFRAEEKRRAREAKTRARQDGSRRRRVFVLDFRGDIRASAVASLREEVTAVLLLAREQDEIVLRLENAGGLVYEHGLASSQLLRLRQRGVSLTVAVDRIAASGGYMMACVADRLLAAPFAVLGSIGVILQLPNFHRALEAHGVDFEQIKGGQFKRTLTLFGENTQADREKTHEEIEETHALFKGFVAEHRPAMDIERVATGEHWYGTQALDLGLCDTITTSDDYLVAASADADIYELQFKARRPLLQRLASTAKACSDALLIRGISQPGEGRYAL
jgi:serine protease SohB